MEQLTVDEVGDDAISYQTCMLCYVFSAKTKRRRREENCTFFFFSLVLGKATSTLTMLKWYHHTGGYSCGRPETGRRQSWNIFGPLPTFKVVWF